MAKLSKRTQAIRAKVKPNTTYALNEALALVKETANAKFDESVDVAVVLGIDAKKSDQAVRGSVVLPAGTGKSVRVAVFTQGAKADEAKAAGADIVGFDDLAARVKEGFMDFDVVIASPDAMRIVGQLGQILGPRGLMPNPKVGTVTPDVAGAVRNAKRPGAVPCRQGGDHPRHHRPCFVRCRQAEDQHDRADRCAEQGEACLVQGHLPAQDRRLLDDGHRRTRRSRLADGAVT